MALRNTDRILILEKVDPKRNVGLVDTAVFAGKNNLHITMDPSTCLWYFRYERGIVPPALRQKYSDFKYAKEAAELYLKSRNIRIVKIID